MAFGFQVLNGSGTVTYSTLAEGGLFLGTFDVPATGSNVTQSYSNATGRAVIFGTIGTANRPFNTGPTSALSVASVTVSYGSGYPVLTAVPQGRACRVYVFVE